MSGLQVEQLLTALKTLDAAAPVAANKQPRTALKVVLAFLEEHRAKSVSELADALEAQRPPPKTAARKSVAKKAADPNAPVKPRAPPKPNATVVEDVLRSLRAAETSPEAFAAAVAVLRENKKARLVELVEVVRGYSGDKSSIAKRPAAIGVIEQTFDQRWKSQRRA